jgi:hypothetical protein
MNFDFFYIIIDFSIKPSRDPTSDPPPPARPWFGSRPEVGNHRCRGLLLLPITLSDTRALGRTPLDEWSARRRDLYLTIHNTRKNQTMYNLIYRLSLLSCPWVRQLYRIESLYPSGHAVTASVLTGTIKGTPCIYLLLTLQCLYKRPTFPALREMVIWN